MARAGSVNPSFDAPLNYLEHRLPGLATWAYDPPDGSPRFNGRLHAVSTTIADARGLPRHGDVDLHGFTLLERPSAVADFWDDAQVRDIYCREAAGWIARALGAEHVVVFDHTCRRRAAHRPPLDGVGGSFSTVREPVGRVHADFTLVSGPMRVQPLLEAEGGRVLPDFRIVGLWRPLATAALQDAPLALAAVASVAPDDLVPNAIVYPQRRGETYAVLHNPRHRWYYYPRMTSDEAILFLHYDSRQMAAGEGRAHAGTVPHTAFEEPGTPVDAAPRQSIELRALVW